MTAPAFTEARREAIRLLIGLAGGTGSGKTYSGLRLATGLAGDARFALIDTENGRALHYADEFAFDHAALEPPFSPARYLEAILAADAAGYPVIVVDSASHEHAGDGGLLDMQTAEFERMGSREAAKMSSWIKPKAEHKRYVSELLRLRAHVILCFRAEQKVEMTKDDSGRWQVLPKKTLTGLDGWVPISEKSLPFELTVSFLLTPDAPGIPKPIKLPDRLRPLIPLDVPLNEEEGRELGAWAAGPGSRANPSVRDTPSAEPVSSPSAGSAGGTPVTGSADPLELVAARLIAAGAITLEQLIASLALDRELAPDQIAADDLAQLIAKLSDEERAGYLERLSAYEASLA